MGCIFTFYIVCSFASCLELLRLFQDHMDGVSSETVRVKFIFDNLINTFFASNFAYRMLKTANVSSYQTSYLQMYLFTIYESNICIDSLTSLCSTLPST